MYLYCSGWLSFFNIYWKSVWVEVVVLGFHIGFITLNNMIPTFRPYSPWILYTAGVMVPIAYHCPTTPIYKTKTDGERAWKTLVLGSVTNLHGNGTWVWVTFGK